MQTQFPVEYGLQYPPGLGPPALLADSSHEVAGGGGPGPQPCLKINQDTRVMVQGPVYVRQGEVREVKGHERIRPEPACKVKVSIIRNKHFILNHMNANSHYIYIYIYIIIYVPYLMI